MALINSNNAYIKLEKDGSFSVYKDKETRDIQKAATDYSTILADYETLKEKAYDKMLSALKKNGITKDLYTEERREEFMQKVEENAACKKAFSNYHKLLSECHNYKNDVLSYKGAQHSYPEMKKKHKDVEASVPNIVCKGGASLLIAESVDEAYEKAKSSRIFGDTTDA